MSKDSIERRAYQKEYWKGYRSRPGVREERAGYQQTYLIKKPWAKTFKNIKRRCRNKDSYYCEQGIKCLITLKELEFLWNRDKAHLMMSPSIDRRNGGHYTLDNCRYVELIDNQSKEKWRNEEGGE